MKKTHSFNSNFLFTAISIAFFFQSNSNFPQSFEKQWKNMQEIYDNIRQWPTDKSISFFVHPHWRSTQKEIEKMITGPTINNFLGRDPLVSMMVRAGFSSPQKFELSFLKYFLSKNTQNLLRNLNDTTFGGISFECRELNCSSNSLGQLFYLAKILEITKNKSINTIIEFGGGFGSLARFTKMAIPHATYIIFDLPEIIALQYLFLKSTLPNTEVIVHKEKVSDYKKQAIHLIPVYLLHENEINCDIFFSAFGLTEATEKVQSLVVEKKFFKASLTYIIGQLPINTNQNWEAHSTIVEGIRNSYPLHYMHPFHILRSGMVGNYEIFGLNTNWLST